MNKYYLISLLIGPVAALSGVLLQALLSGKVGRRSFLYSEKKKAYTQLVGLFSNDKKFTLDEDELISIFNEAILLAPKELVIEIKSLMWKILKYKDDELHLAEDDDDENHLDKKLQRFDQITSLSETLEEKMRKDLGVR